MRVFAQVRPWVHHHPNIPKKFFRPQWIVFFYAKAEGISPYIAKQFYLWQPSTIMFDGKYWSWDLPWMGIEPESPCPRSIVMAMSYNNPTKTILFFLILLTIHRRLSLTWIHPTSPLTPPTPMIMILSLTKLYGWIFSVNGLYFS